MHFRLTARDSAGPAPAEGFDEAVVAVSDEAGPFLVTVPNGTLTWNGPGPHAIAWDVAGTDVPPVSCATVDVDLSTDGGFTFDRSLAVNLLNDGSDALHVGGADTSTARIRVACRGNVFFDISDANFAIAGAAGLIFADSFESNDSSRWSETVAFAP